MADALPETHENWLFSFATRNQKKGRIKQINELNLNLNRKVTSAQRRAGPKGLGNRRGGQQPGRRTGPPSATRFAYGRVAGLFKANMKELHYHSRAAMAWPQPTTLPLDRDRLALHQ